MTRHLPTAIALLALLAGCALLALQFRSHSVRDAVHFVREWSDPDAADPWWVRRRCTAWSVRGMIIVEWTRQSWRGPDQRGLIHEQARHTPPPFRYNSEPASDRWPPRTGSTGVPHRFGFYFTRRAQYVYGERSVVCVPTVLPAALLAAPAVLRLRKVVVGMSRRRSGRCAACGYDLRASPGACPECGTPPAGPVCPPALAATP